MTLYQAVIATPMPYKGARLALRIDPGGLCAIEPVGRAVPEQEPAGTLAAEVACQLERYFEDPSWRFSVPLPMRGTPYQQRVWAALRQIPAGRTWTYGELVARVGGSARAVGNACRCNPVPVVIPCHRVVSRHGLGGYMGETDGAALAIKSWLLAHESGRGGGED